MSKKPSSKNQAAKKDLEKKVDEIEKLELGKSQKSLKEKKKISDKKDSKSSKQKGSVSSKSVDEDKDTK